jgi:hypothetical protein
MMMLLLLLLLLLQQVARLDKSVAQQGKGGIYMQRTGSLLR